MDSSSTEYRKKRDAFWIKQLRTVYSYGSNKDLSELGKKDNDSMVGRKCSFST